MPHPAHRVPGVPGSKVTVFYPLQRTNLLLFFWVQKVQSPGCVGWGGLLQADPFLRCVWDPSSFPPSPYLTGTSHCCVSVFTRSCWGTSLHFGISLCKLLVSVFSAALNSGIYSEFRLTFAVLLSLLQVLFWRKAFKKEWRYMNILNSSHFLRGDCTQP